MNFYIKNGKKMTGPFSFEEMKAMWENGEITRQTLYCKAGVGENEWQNIELLLPLIDPTARFAAKHSPAILTNKVSLISLLVGCISILAVCFMYGLPWWSAIPVTIIWGILSYSFSKYWVYKK